MSDLDKITKIVPASTLPLTPPEVKVETAIDIYKANSVIWQKQSEELLGAYKHGWNFGKYANTSKPDVMHLMARLSAVITFIISNECTKNGGDSSKFIHHFKIIENSLILLAQEYANLKMPNNNKPETMIATLHGFIDSFINNIYKE